MTDEDAQRVDAEVEAEVQQAVNFADASPDPDVAALYDNIYGPSAMDQFDRMAPGGPFDSALPTATYESRKSKVESN